MDYLDNPLPASIAGEDQRAAKKVRISTGVHSPERTAATRPDLPRGGASTATGAANRAASGQLTKVPIVCVLRRSDVPPYGSYCGVGTQRLQGA